MLLIVKSLYRLLLLIILVPAAHQGFAQTLFEMPDGVESRWASGENPKGEKGRKK